MASSEVVLAGDGMSPWPAISGLQGISECSGARNKAHLLEEDVIWNAVGNSKSPHDGIGCREKTMSETWDETKIGIE